MLERQTVFVLGAGASCPYGLPSGLELSKIITNGLRSGQPLMEGLMRNVSRNAEELSRFREEFLESGRNSVDAFLEHRLDLVELGKIITAYALIERENKGTLFTFDDSWLRELYGRMNTKFDDFISNKIAFVTFNYDRTVEHFFFRSLLNTYGKHVHEVSAVMNKIQIVHLHGRLGYLPWQGGGEWVPYNSEISTESVLTGANNIKIIHEDISEGEDSDFAAAKRLLRDAEQIIFMGFAYNSKNVQRLDIASLREGRAIGTCVGLGSNGENAAREITDHKVTLIGGNCTHFVREVMKWK